MEAFPNLPNKYTPSDLLAPIDNLKPFNRPGVPEAVL